MGAVLSVAGLLLFMTGILQLSDKNIMLCVILVTAGTLFAISVFLLSVLKLSAFETGLMLMPMTAGMMGLVMMVAMGLMVLGIVLTFSLKKIKK